MKSPPALVKPELLVWARNSANLAVEAVAKRLDVRPDQVRAWEDGSATLSVAQLRKFANVVKRPLAVFFLPEVPRDFVVMRDFRRQAETGEPMSPELTYEIRSARERREVAVNLASAVGQEPLAFALTATEDEAPEQAAQRLRQALGLSLDEQFQARDAAAALRLWKLAAERLGVLVFEMKGVDSGEARGFSIFDARFPVVVLNGSDSPNGRIFTLGHELAHLMVRGGGVCEFLEHVSNEARKTEQFCNRVAAALFMPASALQLEPDAAKSDSVNVGALQRLAKRFRVSQEAMLIRLAELRRLPASVVAPTIAKLQKAWRDEVEASKDPDKDVIIPQHVLALKKHGRAFAELVMSAYGSEAITLSEVSNYLELRVKHVEKLRIDLWQKAG